jgi:cytochrome b6-f complex iron-sulfur subunit
MHAPGLPVGSGRGRQLNCPCHTTSFAVSGELLRHQLPMAPRPLPQLQGREMHGDVQIYAPLGPIA